MEWNSNVYCTTQPHPKDGHCYLCNNCAEYLCGSLPSLNYCTVYVAHVRIYAQNVQQQNCTLPYTRAFLRWCLSRFSFLLGKKSYDFHLQRTNTSYGPHKFASKIAELKNNCEIFLAPLYISTVHHRICSAVRSVPYMYFKYLFVNSKH